MTNTLPPLGCLAMNPIGMGINHLTLSVSDLARSFQFYTDVRGLKPMALWSSGAYLTCGPTWAALREP